MKPSMVLMFSVLMTLSAQADHPNSGDRALTSLIEEAMSASLEIKEAEKNHAAAVADRKKIISSYLPQVAVEGGYMDNRIDSEYSRSPFGYGVVRMNLYNGGKDHAQLNAREKEADFQKIMIEKMKARIEREVSRLYYELLYFQEGISVKKEALEINRSQKQQAEKRKRAGFTSQADVLEFELREATLKSDINLLQQEEAAKERELARLLSRGEESPLRVAGHLHRETFRKNISDLRQRALRGHEAIIETEKNIAVSHSEQRALFGEYLPTVDLEGRYGKLVDEEKVFDRGDNSSIMFKVSIPLFSGLDTVYGRQAKAQQIAREEVTAEKIRLEVDVRLRNALAKLKALEERLDIEEKNIERSKAYYDITMSEYKKGVKNSPDVAGAAERLFDARLRNLEYRKDFYVTCLEVAEGLGISGAEILK